MTFDLIQGSETAMNPIANRTGWAYAQKLLGIFEGKRCINAEDYSDSVIELFNSVLLTIMALKPDQIVEKVRLIAYFFEILV